MAGRISCGILTRYDQEDIIGHLTMSERAYSPFGRDPLWVVPRDVCRLYQVQTPERVSALIGDGLCEGFALHLAAQGKAGVTIRVYKNAVHLFQIFLLDRRLPQGVTTIQSEHVEAFIARVEETRSRGTAYSRYWGLRQFFEWQVDEDVIPMSPMAGVSQPHKPGKSRRARTERASDDMDSVELLSTHSIARNIRGA